MSESTLQVSAVLAAVPTADPQRSAAFYEALIGRPADTRPMPGLLEWQWGSAALQVVEDAERAGGGLVSVVVPDMAAALEGARGRGLAVGAGDGTVVAQFAVLTDPDGNQVTLVQA